MEKIDCLVIGAGVIGLAVARALAARGREVLVVEAESAFGTGISARNSEVIHAGSTILRVRSRPGCAWPAAACSTPIAPSAALTIGAAAS